VWEFNWFLDVIAVTGPLARSDAIGQGFHRGLDATMAGFDKLSCRRVNSNRVGPSVLYGNCQERFGAKSAKVPGRLNVIVKA
jgi:hypothetical protein